MNVFLSVGSLFPFDRLVREVDDWCGEHPEVKATAQIGDGEYLPKHMQYDSELDTQRFDRMFDEADLVIAHAGMGIILKALMSGKPLLVMPRRVSSREVTTDHQMATARAMEDALGLHVAWESQDLRRMLQDTSLIGPGRSIGPFASPELIEGLRQFMEGA